MNKENLNILLEHLGSIPKCEWNMGSELEKRPLCGCFIDHTLRAFDIDPASDYDANCRDIMGLDPQAFKTLTVPCWLGMARWSCSDPDSPEFISLPRAILVLRKLIEIGYVDWGIR